MHQRILSFIFVLFFLASSPVSTVYATDVTEETAPVSHDFSLEGFDGEDTLRSWENNVFFQRLEKQTGISLAFVQHDNLKSWQARKDALRSGDTTALPDAFFKADFSTFEENQLFEKGVIIDLKPYLQEFAPNLYAILQADPLYVDMLEGHQGAILSLPFINYSPTQNAMWINVKWLNELGLSMPTDLESFENVLRAFKEQDPNKNIKDDEIPLTFLGSFDLKFLAHAFGIIANDYNVFEKDGVVHFAPLEENFPAFVRWCHAMFQENIFDKDGFRTTDSLRKVTDEKTEQKYGVLLNPRLYNLIPMPWMQDYEMLMPLAHEGTQQYRSFSNEMITGTFAITTACKDVGKLLGWVDNFYTEEGGILMSVGKQNEDFVIDGDGTWRFTDTTQENTYFVTDSTLSNGNPSPGISVDAFQSKFHDPIVAELAKQMNTFNQYTVSPFPLYDLTDEQIAFITPLQNDIGYYVDMQIARWVIGEEPFDETTYATFKETLQSKNVDAFIEFWQNILDTNS